MPDGGVAGGYANWFSGGGFGPPRSTFDRAFADWVPRLTQALGTIADVPEVFEYRTTRRQFEFYGWTVRILGADDFVSNSVAKVRRGVPFVEEITLCSRPRPMSHAAEAHAHVESEGLSVVVAIEADSDGIPTIEIPLSGVWTSVVVIWSI